MRVHFTIFVWLGFSIKYLNKTTPPLKMAYAELAATWTRLMMCWETPNMKHIKLINVHTSFGAHWSVTLRDACLFSKWKLSPQTLLPSWHTPQPSFYLHLGDFVNIQCSASETEWPEKGHAQNFRKRSLWKAKNCVRPFRGPTQLSLHV